MYKRSKRLVALLTVLAILASFTFVLAEGNQDQLITRIVCTNGTVTVSGKAGSANVFLLNPGKTVSDLESAQSENFDSVVNFCTIVTGDQNRDYTLEFTINNYSSESDYILYVKEGSTTVTKVITGRTQRIYVSASADPAVADGTAAHPYASINAAKAAVRNIVTSGNVEVILSGGRYNIDSTIEFTVADSAPDGSMITYKAASGETVTLSGAKEIAHSNIKRVTDASILSKVSSDAAENLVEIDLAAANIPSDIVDFTGSLQPVYSAKPMGVFLNGKRQSISRWPNAGYKAILEGSTEGGRERDGTQALCGASVKIEDLDASRAAKWANADNMYVEGYLGNTWHGEWAKVDSVNANNLTVNLEDYTKYGVVAGNRIAAVNLMEEIDMPGEWYADPNAMKLYYYAPKELGAGDVLEIGVLDSNFMTFNYAENISIENINFEMNAADPSIPETDDNGGNGILMMHADNIAVRNCDFREIGLDGIRMRYSNNITVSGCDIYSTGFSGIVDQSSGDRRTLTSGNNVISNNIISSACRDTKASSNAGIQLNSGVGTVVENNVLNNFRMAAIRYYGNSYKIRNNEIYDAMYETLDFGAVYAGRSFTDYGTEIRNNYFHKIGEYGLVGDGSDQAAAVFWDDHMSGNSFIGNIVDMGTNQRTAGIKIGGGRDNTVTGNIFVNSAYPIYAESREGTFATDSELYRSFAKAAKDGTTVTNLTANDWLDAFAAQFPGIMENYNDILGGAYYRKNVITNNTYYNCQSGPRIGQQIILVGGSNNVQRNPGQFNLTNIGTSQNTANAEYTAFDLLYPANGANVPKTSTVITWESSAFCDDYTYEVATNAGFSSLVATGTTRATFAELSGLNANTTYYWRVYANNASGVCGGRTACTAAYSFTTNGEFKVENVSYSAGRFNYTVKNGTSAAKTATCYLALKDSQGKLIELKIKKHNVTASQTVNDYIANDFTQTVQNGVIELYFWDDNQAPLTKFKYTYQ